MAGEEVAGAEAEQEEPAVAASTWKARHPEAVAVAVAVAVRWNGLLRMRQARAADMAYLRSCPAPQLCPQPQMQGEAEAAVSAWRWCQPRQACKLFLLWSMGVHRPLGFFGTHRAIRWRRGIRRPLGLNGRLI